MTKLQQSYDNACNAYLKAFCKQYDMQYDNDAWVAREVGTIAEVSDLFLSMQDIKLCVDKKVKWDDLIEWYDYNLDAHTVGLDTINLKSWLMGCPRTSKEKEEKIRNNIIELIKQSSSILDKQNQEQMISWLENQKPAEWREEDENNLTTIISEIEANKLESEEFEHETYNNLVHWLKSIKPNHWKPSEKQINDLYYAAMQLSVTRPQLQSLYNDLKKLLL